MTRTTDAGTGALVSTLIPARIDRLPWSPFHTRMVVALGVAWILDGLEITIASSVAGVLSTPAALNLSSTAVGLVATVYLAGEVVGALVFGRLSDAMGRKRLFLVTLAIYMFGSGLTALTAGSSAGWVVFLYSTRFIAGLGIGGEYAAINSAIDELIPARYRGRVDVAVNGTYWAGAILGTLGSLVFLHALSPGVGWRIGFLLGPVLGAVILVVRRNLPESPRWQIMHGYATDAEASITAIEREVRASGHTLPPIDPAKELEVAPATHVGYLTLVRILFRDYPRRAILGASLMISQSFLYNAIFFTYTLVLTKFYGVNASAAPWYLLAFAAGNLLGPLTLGRLFDTLGRRVMISGSYIGSGALLALTAYLFHAGELTSTTQTVLWGATFFFASAGASAAYLTVSEIFPLEVRAQAIAVFFAIAQCAGALGPVLYGHLIGAGSDRHGLFIGYLIGGGAMIVGGLIEIALGVPAERASLEDIARPLSLVRTSSAALSSESRKTSSAWTAG
jgi:MFS family permease